MHGPFRHARATLLAPHARALHLERLARMLLLIAPAYPEPHAMRLWTHARAIADECARAREEGALRDGGARAPADEGRALRELAR